MSDKESDNMYQLLQKAERFCAYQERSRFEVEKKLRKLGANSNEIIKIIQSLEEDECLNEIRFAKLFSGGKFRIKRWGKNKIRAELRMKNISNTIIQEALDSIDDEEYKKTIEHLVKKKERELTGQTTDDKRPKIVRYLLSKGFESELIWKVFKSPSP